MSYDRNGQTIDNLFEKKRQRKELRGNMTPAEIALWQQLRKKQLSNKRWRRQYGIGPYILDFYCPELHIGIELDGNDHFTPEGSLYDEQRSEYLSRTCGIQLLRFENKDVYHHMDSILEQIKTLIMEKEEQRKYPQKLPHEKNCPA